MGKTLLVFLFLIFSFHGYGQNCTLSATLSSSASDLCVGSSIVLTATASNGSAPYTYIWSTGETTQTISINKAGTYSVTVSDQSADCPPVTKSITIKSAATPQAPTASNVIICQSGPATLSAAAPGGLYQWYDANGTFLASGKTYTAPNITSTTTFYVQTTINGCTSSKTAATVSISNKPAVADSVVCSGNQATMVASGADSYVWYDSATGGKILSTTTTLITPPLSKNTTFYLVATSGSCVSARIPEVAVVSAPPQTPIASGVSVCSGTPAVLHASVTDGGVLQWFSAANSDTPLISSADFTTPTLTSATTYYVQNSSNGCISARTPVKVTITANSNIPADQTQTTCYNTSVKINGSADPTVQYQWYDAPTGGNLLATANSYATPALTNNTTYYIQNINNSCNLARAAINIIVTQPVAPPFVSQPVICSGSMATLTATYPGGIYQWYDAATGGNLLATGATYTTPALLSTTIYYVQTTLSGCSSARTAVTVSVIPPPAAPAVTSAIICTGSVATLTATGVNGNYTWYDAANGGNLLSSGQVFITPALTATTTYYVQVITPTGCSSDRIPAVVTVNPIPSTPAVNSGPAVCPGSAATLTASSPGINQWYDAATGGNLLSTGNSFTTAPLFKNTVFYVQNTNTSCSSERVAVTAKVISITSPAFQYPSGTVCTASANLVPVVNQSGTFSSSPAGLVFVNNKTGEINVSASSPGKYTISFIGDGVCPNPSSTIINIVTNFDAQFSYNTPVCTGGANTFPLFPTGSTAGIFASSSGLIFSNNTTGEIDLTNSKPGTYIITNKIAGSGTCIEKTSSFTLTINPPVAISAGANQQVQAGAPVQLQGSVSGATAKWSGGTGSFSNPASPNAVYTPGAAENSAKLIITSSDPAGPCEPVSASVTITFIPMPDAPSVFDKSICTGNSAVLSAISPGGSYEWYDAPKGGKLLGSGPNFTTPALTATTLYYPQTTINGITSARTTVTVNVSSTPAAPKVATQLSTCSGSSVTLTATGSSGTYEWYDAATGGNLVSTSATFSTPALIQNVSYYVQSVNGSCSSQRVPVNIVVNTVPAITSAASGTICSGVNQSYTVTSNTPGSTFSWSRAATQGISNAAINNQTTAQINEALINTGLAPVNVVYQVTAINGTCISAIFNYVVTVAPNITVKSAANATFCSGIPGNYIFTLSDPSATFTWSRAAVSGISNAEITGQSTNNINEALFNTTNNPVNVTYTFNLTSNACARASFNLVVTVNPKVQITSAASGIACTGAPQDYAITSNIPGATFTWSRVAVTGISNSAVTNQASSTITETLVNTENIPVKVVYVITPEANGCSAPAFTYTVSINPIITAPTISSNLPVCTGSTIQLSTAAVSKATYSWTGPNGFVSYLQSPSIPDVTTANSGTYTLTLIENGCNSPVASYAVKIDALPEANAGPDQLVCTGVTAVQLAGSVSGGTTTGLWSSDGTGKFSPAANQLSGQYLPSPQDKINGSVKLTLRSTSKDDCNISTSTMTIKFGRLQAVDAGPDQNVCSHDQNVVLAGKPLVPVVTVWKTLGTGSFSPNESTPDATYLASADDVSKGSVKLVLVASAADLCYFPTDTMTINFIPPPTVNAGGTRYVLAGNKITLMPTVSEENVQYKWSPDVGINDVTAKNPVITGEVDRTYSLTVTDIRGCQSSDQTFIKVSPELSAPNAFTPNNDGVNDSWKIEGLIAYDNATVDVFDRYGQKVFHSIGYPTPWEGTSGGRLLPSGTYYFIIDTKVHNLVLKGYVAIIR